MTREVIINAESVVSIQTLSLLRRHWLFSVFSCSFFYVEHLLKGNNVFAFVCVQ